MSMELEMKNVALRVGNQIQIKGEILSDAEKFRIDLGCDTEDLALHFNPRFCDEEDGAVIVCNSKAAGSWGDEMRETRNPLQKGSEVKIVVKLTFDMFEVELPDGEEVQFPNREGMDVITYVSIRGDFKLKSFKIR